MRCISVLIAVVLVMFALQESFGKKSKAVKHDKEEDVTDILTSGEDEGLTKGDNGKKSKAVKHDEEEDITDILTKEGQEGWLEEILEKQAKEENQKKPSSKNGKSRDKFHDDSPPSDVFSGLESSLDRMESNTDQNNRGWASRAKNGLTQLKNRWSELPEERRGEIADALNTAAGKLETFANAGDDPVGAIRGALEIIASFARLAGPVGQIVGVVLNFISGFLSLFGKGPSPKPVSEVVREEIEKWYSRDLNNQAEGAIFAFHRSKAFLNGVAKSGNTLSDAEATSLGSHVPVYQGVEFLGFLATEIRNLAGDNKADKAVKCLKYIELYTRMAVLKDVILQQMAALIPDSQSNIREGVYEVQKSLQRSVKELFKFLYESDVGSNVIPYFDPDKYVVTDAYMSEVLKIDNYDRSMAGTYFIYLSKQKLGYSSEIQGYYGTNVCFLTEGNFPWKLVPHGKNLFSILNRYECPGNNLCDAFLTYYSESEIEVAVDHDKPVLWEITGRSGGGYRIRIKYGCNADPPHQMCDSNLHKFLIHEHYFLRTKRVELVVMRKPRQEKSWTLIKVK